MKIFISWSGSKSKEFANLLGKLVQDVIQATEPFISTDIAKGSQWFREISKELSESQFGIFCLTEENSIEPWILFEAGALFKGFDDARIGTVLFNLNNSDLKPPLSLFNGTKFNEDEIFKLFESINSKCEKKLDDIKLKESFHIHYKGFEDKINEILSKDLKIKDHEIKRRYEPILEPHAIDRTSSLADAALYFSRKRFGYKESIKQSLLKGEYIPEFYYYFTEEGAEFWIRMTSDHEYRFHNNSINLIRSFSSKVATRIREITDSIDFISLGSGDGKKDHDILTKMVTDQNINVTYYPIDISDKLLIECIKNVFRDNLDYLGVKTKAILGDITDLAVLKSVYEDCPSTNLFSILGNTFGNSDEAVILEALQSSMYSGDFLLLEVNCDTSEMEHKNSFLTSDLVLEYACLPLTILGLDVDLNKIIVQEKKNLSVFKTSAKSFETLYTDIEIDGQSIAMVPLGYDHRYDFSSFLLELSDILQVDILEYEVVGNAGILLAKKR